MECVRFAPWSNRLHLYIQAVGIHRCMIPISRIYGEPWQKFAHLSLLLASLFDDCGRSSVCWGSTVLSFFLPLLYVLLITKLN